MWDKLINFLEGRWLVFGILIGAFILIGILSQLDARRAKKKEQEKLSSGEGTH